MVAKIRIFKNTVMLIAVIISLGLFFTLPAFCETSGDIVNIMGLSLDRASNSASGNSLTLTVNASRSSGNKPHYRFYYRAGYGTAQYDSNPWLIAQDYSSQNACTHSFADEGSYIYVVRAVGNPEDEPAALPIIGGTFTVGDGNHVNITGLSHNVSGTITPDTQMTFTVNASTRDQDTIYYQFFYRANYGTDSYDTTAWTMIRDYSTENTCTYQFHESGSFIVVARAVTDPNNEPAALPIIGCVVNVENETPDTLVINEIVAKDAEGGNDWIELYVVGSQPVYLADYTLVDDAADHSPVALPEITLNPGEFFVLQAVDEAPVDGAYYVPFKLGSDDSVTLRSGNTVVDVLDWNEGDAEQGFSYGRMPDGTGTCQTLTPTPGTANEAASGTRGGATDRPAGWNEISHSSSAAPDYDTVFAEGVVHRLDVTISAVDWQMMMNDMTQLYGEFGTSQISVPVNSPRTRAMPPDNQQNPPPQAPADGGMGMMISSDVNPLWRPCTLQYNGQTWYHVGIRFKGNSSLKSTWGMGLLKLPFRLDFDQFEDDYPEIDNQRFFGFKKLSLSSNFQDDTFIREKVVADMMRNAGIPAARAAFYRLYVDYGQGKIYFGLYTLLEIPDEPMLAAQFGNAGGNLYKPEGIGATFADYSQESFDKENNEDEADFSDVLALYNALQDQGTGTVQWRNNLESVFNVDGFLRWLAANTVIQNWDAYGIAPHNYYLYNNPDDGRLNWIPWDHNEALKTDRRRPLSLALTWQEVNDRWPLIRYLADDPVYWESYLNHVSQFIETVFNPDTMIPVYQSAHDLIRPYTVGSQGEIKGYAQVRTEAVFDAGLNQLKTHVSQRYNEAMAFVSTHP